MSNDYKNIFALWQGYSEEVEAPERGLWLGLIFNKIKKKATSLPACKSTSGLRILRCAPKIKKRTHFVKKKLRQMTMSNHRNPFDSKLKFKEMKMLSENLNIFFFRVVQKRSRLPREDIGQG